MGDSQPGIVGPHTYSHNYSRPPRSHGHFHSSRRSSLIVVQYNNGVIAEHSINVRNGLSRPPCVLVLEILRQVSAPGCFAGVTSMQFSLRRASSTFVTGYDHHKTIRLVLVKIFNFPSAPNTLKSIILLPVTLRGGKRKDRHYLSSSRNTNS